MVTEWEPALGLQDWACAVMSMTELADDGDDDDTWRSSLSAGATKLITLARKVPAPERAEHQMNDFETVAWISTYQRYFPDHFLCDVTFLNFFNFLTFEPRLV